MSTNIRKTEVDHGNAADAAMEIVTFGIYQSPSSSAIEIKSNGSTKVIEYSSKTERDKAFEKMQK